MDVTSRRTYTGAVALTLAVLGGLMIMSCQEGLALTLYVSPAGKDAWSGRLAKPNAAKTDGPVASLAGARDALRRLRAGAPLTQPVRVLVEGGAYTMTEPVVFGPQDSGTAACPITYEAAPGAHPVFSGGRRITGFRRGADGVWSVKIPEVAEGKWFFDQLWVDGKRATRARLPKKFYYYTARRIDYGVDPATGKPANLANRAFIARPGDIKNWPDLTTDGVMILYHSWETSREWIEHYDPKTHAVILRGSAAWPMMAWGACQRYQIENIREALTQPGEWCLSHSGLLSYMPLPGQDMAKAEVIAPVCDSFVSFEGDAALGLPVEHIALQGLSFRYSQYVLPPGGHSDGQAEASIPAVIMADGAAYITLQNCEIGHIGIYGVWFRRGCHDCSVEHCYLHDLGAGGVRIGETGIEPDLANRTGRVVVDDCIIRAGGRLHAGCIGVWIGQSGNNEVTHNDISDLFYTGVSVGWVWGYGESLAKNNHIDFNRIHNIGQGVLSDMGGIYTLGPSDGTTLNNNVIHDVYSYDYYGRGGWGLYNDEGTSHLVMEDNLVYNTKTGGYHQHYGLDNLSRNNIFAFGMDGQVQRSRVEKHLSFTFEHNIVDWKTGPLVAAGTIKDREVHFRDNLYWDAGKPVSFEGMTLAQRQATGQDLGSIVANPEFVDPAHGDFHLRPGSPAFKIGFKPFDYSQAGVRATGPGGDPAWGKLATDYTYPKVQFAPPPPPPPPLTVDDGFETTPLGSPPAEAHTYTEHHGDSIGVTDETAASGKRSLKIQDAPGLQHDYDPFFYYVPNYTGGVATCSFDMKITPGVVMYNEWRDSSNPYRVGPSFWVRGGELVIWDKPTMALPVDKWIHFEVSAGLGSDFTGTWTLKVTVPGQAEKVFDGLKVGSPDWRTLQWLGWSSPATEKTAYYLDNIKFSDSGK